VDAFIDTVGTGYVELALELQYPLKRSADFKQARGRYHVIGPLSMP
jgi:hypothetical protein